MQNSGASSLKNKFEDLARAPPPLERKEGRGKVGWNDPNPQGQKKLHKKGMTTFGDGLPPKKSLSDLP